MSKKEKKKKVPEQITVRLDFEGELRDLFSDFRFAGRFESNKAAALSLIEAGLQEWKLKNPGDAKPMPEPKDAGSPNDKKSPVH